MIYSSLHCTISDSAYILNCLSLSHMIHMDYYSTVLTLMLTSLLSPFYEFPFDY